MKSSVALFIAFIVIIAVISMVAIPFVGPNAMMMIVIVIGCLLVAMILSTKRRNEAVEV